MKRKRTYQSVPVQSLRVVELLPMLAAGCIVAIDVAKQRFFVALATLAGEVLKIFRFEHPTETRAFLGVVDELRRGVEPGRVRVAMEPTGTYGDAVRHQLVSAGVPVFMVSPKRVHDGQGVFDNVPSLHDAKSAVLIARVCAMNLATQWQPPSSTRTRLRALVELRRHEQSQQEASFGRIEALLMRHWPEYQQWFDVREQKTALRVLEKYASPARVAADVDEVAKFIRSVSRGNVAMELIAGVTNSAQRTLGLPMLSEEENYLRALCRRALEARTQAEQIEEAMREVAGNDPTFQRLAAWMGAYTAAVVISFTDPAQYATARQLEKACGLNLKEKSSGEFQGRLSITKRGPSLVRQVLYLFALRMIQESPAVRAWYSARRSYGNELKRCAVVALMRKLARAIFHVARGSDFDPTKLFDMRRLDLVESAEQVRRGPTPRTTQRPLARNRKSARARAEVSAT